ncbi:MAG: SDR family NAD(P)-dependent oxidoreductase [Rhodothalassiaceae bacterium]
MDLGLRGKRAIVTGATRGIGRAISDLLAAEGADIAFCARKEAAVKERVKELAGRGVRAFGAAVDVGDGPAYKAWLEAAARELGGVDLFIANASAGAGAEGEAAWEANFRVDLMHSVRGCETLLPHLARSDGGAVVFITTIAAVETFFAPTAYGALKAALITYGKQLGQALAGHGIRVNMVSPGPVLFPGGDWDRVRHERPEVFAEVEGQCALGRMATPEEVARAVVFLASPAAGAITGSNLVIDAGFTKRVQF